jgi:Cysteine/serine-rich nuclear protein N-terminus
MPPPPPPSASYLWKFDALSDDSEDDEQQLPKCSRGSYTETSRIEESSTSEQPSSNFVATLMTTTESLSISPSAMHAVNATSHALSDSRQLEGIICDEDDEVNLLGKTCESPDNESISGDDGPCEDQQTTYKSASRKRKKRKKKKKKQPFTATPLTKHSVSFGAVSVHSFERCLGGTVVPGDGGWPLGLGDAASSKELVSVDEFESSKQERLLSRLHFMQHSTGSCSAPSSPKIEDESLAVPLETRQWDYKHKVRNPLFGTLSEQDRMHLLLASSTGSNHPSPQPPPPSSCPDSPSGRKHVRRSTRQRSGSEDASTAAAPSRTRSRSGSFAEQYNEVYNQMEVHHCRNELEQIRNSRTMEGSTGCACRKLQVYLLPPNAGKKAHHRRLKLLKVKEELRKRCLLPPDENHSREELELLLHNAVEQEPCCRADSCPCSRNGIECQADSCSCWYTSHQTKQQQQQDVEHTNSGSSVASITPAEIVARCGNPEGMYTVDMEKIDAFRRQYLSSLAVCPEIAPPTSSSIVTPTPTHA